MISLAHLPQALNYYYKIIFYTKFFCLALWKSVLGLGTLSWPTKQSSSHSNSILTIGLEKLILGTDMT